MVREDILESLRSALSRGYSLKIAMQSLYNAGYKKEEIEEAARTLHGQAPAQQLTQAKVQQKVHSQTQHPQQPKMPQQIHPTSIQAKPEIKVKKPTNMLSIIFLMIILILLIGGLIAMIIFKNEIISFLEDLFL